MYNSHRAFVNALNIGPLCFILGGVSDLYQPDLYNFASARPVEANSPGTTIFPRHLILELVILFSATQLHLPQDFIAGHRRTITAFLTSQTSMVLVMFGGSPISKPSYMSETTILDLGI